MTRRTGRSLGWLVIKGAVSTSLCASCVPSNADRTPSPEIPCVGALDNPTPTALPDSHWIRFRNGSIEKLSAAGAVAWSAPLRSKDALLRGISVASNSTVYLRTKQQLMALGSSGQWLWEQPAPIESDPDPSYAPVAMADSGVILRTGAGQYRSYAHDGSFRWTADISLKPPIRQPPLVLRNGSIVLRGAEDFVTLAADGLVHQ